MVAWNLGKWSNLTLTSIFLKRVGEKPPTSHLLHLPTSSQTGWTFPTPQKQTSGYRAGSTWLGSLGNSKISIEDGIVYRIPWEEIPPFDPMPMLKKNGDDSTFLSWDVFLDSECGNSANIFIQRFGSGHWVASIIRDGNFMDSNFYFWLRTFQYHGSCIGFGSKLPSFYPPDATHMRISSCLWFKMIFCPRKETDIFSKGRSVKHKS